MNNLRKFNVVKSVDTINPEDFDNIIGIDFGHGESSAAIISTQNPAKIDDLFLTNTNMRKDITAVFIGNDQSVVPGYHAREEVDINPRGKFYQGFKARPDRLKNKVDNDQRTKEELVQTYFQQLILDLNKYNSSQMKGRNLFFVGCPSGDDWKNQALNYSRILSKGLKTPVIIMPESRASLIKVYQEKKSEFNLEKGTVVFDLGSSTFDCTFVNGDGRVVEEFSEPLGASLIEREMLKKALEKSSKEVKDLETTLIDLRMLKEKYFDHPQGESFIRLRMSDGSKGETLTIDREFMDDVVSKREVRYSSFDSGEVRGSWKSLCEQTFIKAKKLINGRSAGNILLTGGASRMEFVAETCKKVFGINPVVDSEPSFCVSRGLAMAGYTNLISGKIVDITKNEIKEKISQSFKDLEGLLGNSLGNPIYSIVLSQFDEWSTPATNSVTLQGVFDQCQTKIRNFCLSSEGKKLMNEACDQWADQTRKTIVSIVNDNFKEVQMLVFTDSEWARILEETLNELKVAIDWDRVIDNLDLFSAASKVIRVFFAIILGIIGFFEYTLRLFFGDEDPAAIRLIDDLMKKDARTTYDREKRYEIYQQLKNDKEFKDSILENISSSIGKSLELQKYRIVNIVNTKSEQSIEDAVDQMLLNL